MRLYKAIGTVTAIFLHEGDPRSSEAREFVEQEIHNGIELSLVEEITEEHQIPSEWTDGNVWNSAEDITPKEFLIRERIRLLDEEKEKLLKQLETE